MQEKWDKIPSDTDFLITHMPPFEICDSFLQKNLGCPMLQQTVLERVRPSVHMFGYLALLSSLPASFFKHSISYLIACSVRHVHAARGVAERGGTVFINSATALPENRSPIVFDYSIETKEVTIVSAPSFNYSSTSRGTYIKNHAKQRAAKLKRNTTKVLLKSSG